MSENEVQAAEVVVTLTKEEIAFRERMHRAGIPGLLVSMYAGQLRKVEENEREACARLCDKQAQDLSESDHWTGCASYLANKIRRRK